MANVQGYRVDQTSNVGIVNVHEGPVPITVLTGPPTSADARRGGPSVRA